MKQRGWLVVIDVIILLALGVGMITCLLALYTDPFDTGLMLRGMFLVLLSISLRMQIAEFKEKTD